MAALTRRFYCRKYFLIAISNTVSRDKLLATIAPCCCSCQLLFGFLLTQSSQGISINNIKKVAKHLATNPDASYTTTWLELAVVLETGPVFSFAKLHELNHNEFRLAM